MPRALTLFVSIRLWSWSRLLVLCTATLLITAQTPPVLAQGAPPPTWLAAAGMGVPRQSHTATVLNTGQVLVAGGLGAGGSLPTTTELFDPSTGRWSPTGALPGGRYQHTATLLNDGRVLIAGGRDASGVTDVALLYNPATGTWAPTGGFQVKRTLRTATLMPDGKVLVVGGFNQINQLAGDGELYDPASGRWSPADGNLPVADSAQTATLLNTGGALMAGGYGGPDASKHVLPDAFLYTPRIPDLINASPGTFLPTGSMHAARQGHTASLLTNGRVLVAGSDAGAAPLASAELYDPTTATWTATGALGTARSGHTAALLPDGHVLVAGGTGGTSGALNSSELYSPAQQTWSAAANMHDARTSHALTQLLDGRVLVTGGANATGTLANAELFGAAGPVPPASPLKTLVNPARVFDTRPIANPIVAGAERCLPLAGLGGIPFDAVGAVVNLTAADQRGTGWLTLYPAGQAVPRTSTLNFDTRESAIASGAIVRFGTGGQVCLDAGQNAADVILDVTGYLPVGASTLIPLLPTPLRAFDSRTTGTPLMPGTPKCFAVSGLPANAAGLIANVTAVGYSASGWLTVFPAVPAPATSTLNFDPRHLAIANNVIVALGSSNQVCLQTGQASSHVILDVMGSVTADGALGLPLLAHPVRLVDTHSAGGAVVPRADRCFTVVGGNGIPSTATGVVLNLTAADQSARGWLTLYPAGQPLPPTSTLNFDATESAIANGAIVRVGTNGQVCVSAGQSAAEVILDAVAYIP